MNVLAAATVLLAATPLLDTGAGAPSPLPAQARECNQRVGPFATQDRAWAAWRQTRDEANWRGPAYGVSNGVVPCWDQNIRGYCFFVFYPC